MKPLEFKRPEHKKLNIEIISYSTDDVFFPIGTERSRCDFHTLFFVQTGNGQLEIDFEDYTIGENQMVIIPRGTVQWAKHTDSITGYAILFNDDFFAEVQKQLLNGFLQYAIALRKLRIPIEQDQIATISYYFELLKQEQQGVQNQNQTFILQNLMLALLNKLEGLIQNLPEVNSFITTRSPFQRFIELVEINYGEHQNLDFYTSQLQLTNRKLNDILKQITGQTATHFIIDRIIIEAKRELCFSDKSVKEIAYLLGYDSQYYFSRIFKKRTQLSPEQFRMQFAE